MWDVASHRVSEPWPDGSPNKPLDPVVLETTPTKRPNLPTCPLELGHFLLVTRPSLIFASRTISHSPSTAFTKGLLEMFLSHPPWR